MKVLFRVDASLQIGSGHVMRCLALANELKFQGIECLFICREHEGNLIHLIINNGFEVHSLLQVSAHMEQKETLEHSHWLGSSQIEDAAECAARLIKFQPDWIVVDHYALDNVWESAIRQHCNQLIVIDDLADRCHNCDILLDQNLGRNSQDYDGLVPEYCERLIGPQFALLRPEFARLREKSLRRRRVFELKRVLVTLGGIDLDNVTGQVLDSLNKTKLPNSTVIDVVMGASAPHLTEIIGLAERSRFEVSVSANVKDMAERMCKADIVIGAAGSTSWERCCLGLPGLTLVLASNQQRIADALQRAKATIIIDSNAPIADALMDENRVAETGTHAARICDGLGAAKVAARITR